MSHCFTALGCLLVTAALTTPGGASAASPILLPDGDFEQPVAAPLPFVTLFDGETFAGWHVVGSIDIVSADLWPAAHGAQSVDIDGFSTGGLWRDVGTITGHPYELIFAL